MLGGWLGNLLSGLFDAIFDPIMAWALKAISWVANLLFKYVIGPCVAFVFNLINYVLAILWYNISMFILSLIDYVQILFKLLAGLSVDGMQFNLAGSKFGNSDLLIQLIMSNDIKNVFLSMCIVGIFLLVITTIFQIIKVEYTTEGAKNAKGPILNKAFKGLCNMIMIPALCICGVFIGNQVLELLDTATKPSAKASISGQLFVAAASDAFYKANDIQVIMLTSLPDLAIALLIPNIFGITWNSVSSAWQIGEDGSISNNPDYENGKTPSASYHSVIVNTGGVDKVEAKFLEKEVGFNYYLLYNVSRYYDYSRINYLLLIFGGCILLKTLYFTCFGMIVRLYQCGTLFIISPAVIGMTPINESGLGKWRSDFIGSAISAYGVVLAMNIYLILVKILLSIKFDFTSYDDYVLGASLMEGLLKCIIVIGGAVYIEKFSGQIGGYFGAKDALAQGKEMEKGTKAAVKSVAEGAVKAVGTGVQIAAMATGVGGAAVGAAKGLGAAMKAGGAAAKVAGGSKLGNFARGVGGGIKGGAGHVMSSMHRQMDKPIEYIADSLGFNYTNYDDRKKYSKPIKKADKMLERQNKGISAIDSELDSEYGKNTDIRSKLDRARESGNASDVAKYQAEFDISNAKIDKLNAVKSNALDRRDLVEKDKKKLEEEKRESDIVRAAQRMYRHEAFREAGKAGWQEHTMGGQVYAGLKKQFGAWGDAGAKNGGDEISNAKAYLDKLEADARQDAANDRNKRAISEKNERQEVIMTKLLAERGELQNLDVKKQVTSAMDNLDYFQQKKDEALANGDKDKASRYDERLIDGIASVAKQFGIAQKDIVQGDGGKWEITASAKADIMLDPDKLAGIAKKAFADMRKGMKQEEAIKNAVEDAISGKSADYARMIQKAVEEVLARWDKGK